MASAPSITSSATQAKLKLQRCSNTLKTRCFWRSVAPAEPTECPMVRPPPLFSAKPLNDRANLPSKLVNKGGVIHEKLWALTEPVGGDDDRLSNVIILCGSCDFSDLKSSYPQAVPQLNGALGANRLYGKEAVEGQQSRPNSIAIYATGFTSTTGRNPDHQPARYDSSSTSCSYGRSIASVAKAWRRRPRVCSASPRMASRSGHSLTFSARETGEG